MSLRYSIDEERSLILTVGEGVLTDEDVLGLKAKLLADPLFHSGLREISDLREVTALQVTPEGIASFAGFDRAHTEEASGHRLALVAPQDLVYGMARMYEGFSSASSSVGVFRTMEEALEWLDVG